MRPGFELKLPCDMVWGCSRYIWQVIRNGLRGRRMRLEKVHQVPSYCHEPQSRKGLMLELSLGLVIQWAKVSDAQKTGRGGPY